METRIYYIPATSIGRYILNHIVDNVGCSIGAIHKVADTLAVAVTTPKRDVVKVERILQMYDLI